MKIALVFCPWLEVDSSPGIPPIGIASMAGWLKANGYPDVAQYDYSIQRATELVAPHLRDKYLLARTEMQGPKFFSLREFVDFDTLSILNLRWFDQLIRETFADGLTLNSAAPTPLRSLLENWVDELEQYDVVGFSAIFMKQLPFIVTMAQELRRRARRPLIVVGGTFLSSESKFYFGSRAYVMGDYVDAAFQGDGEHTFLTYLNQLQASGNGVCGSGTKDIPPQLVRHLDELPPPDYATLLAKYQYLGPYPILPVAVTRGCYWRKCEYCSYGLAEGGKGSTPYRKMSPGKIVELLKTLSAQCNTRSFFFSGDAVDPGLLAAMAGELTAQSVSVTWSADVRADRGFLREGLIERLAKSGCRWLWFGIESVVQRVQDNMCKGTTAQIAQEIVSKCIDHGIASGGGMFVGFPSETASEAVETQTWAEKLSERQAYYPPWSYQASTRQPIIRRALDGRSKTLELIDASMVPVHNQLEWVNPAVLRSAFNKTGMTWEQTDRQERIGVVNFFCKPKALIFPWFPDGGCELHYLVQYSLAELQIMLSTIRDCCVIQRRLQKVFCQTWELLITRETSFNLDELQKVVEISLYDRGGEPGTKLEVLGYLYDVFSRYLERQFRSEGGCSLITRESLVKSLDDEYASNRELLRPDDRIPEVAP